MPHWDLNEIETREVKGRKRYRVVATGVEFFHPKPVNYQERPIAFLDIETSGFDHLHCDILEVGIERTDRNTPLVYKLPLLSPQHATEEALDLVGYDAEEWAKEAVPWSMVVQEIWDWLAEGSPAIVGHNVFRFDWLFLEWRLRALGFPTHLIGRPIVDTLQLAFARFHGQQDAPDRLKLDNLCVYYGLPPEGVHRALGGVQRVRKLYERLRP